jgi:hypothetical protein
MAADCCFVGSEAKAAAPVFPSSATEHDSLPLQLPEHYQQTLLLRLIILITVCLFRFISYCYCPSSRTWTADYFSSRKLGASHSHSDSGSGLAGETTHTLPLQHHQQSRPVRQLCRVLDRARTAKRHTTMIQNNLIFWSLSIAD